MWRSLLTFLGFAEPAPTGAKLREACMSRLAELDKHADEFRRIEVRSHIREAKAAADPSREEMKLLRRKRLDAIDAAFRGKDDIR